MGSHLIYLSFEGVMVIQNVKSPFVSKLRLNHFDGSHVAMMY